MYGEATNIRPLQFAIEVIGNRISCPNNQSKQIQEPHTAYSAGTQYLPLSLNEKQHTWLHRHSYTHTLNVLQILKIHVSSSCALLLYNCSPHNFEHLAQCLHMRKRHVGLIHLLHRYQCFVGNI